MFSMIAAPILSGIAGSLFGSGARAEANRLRGQAGLEIDKVAVPTLADLEVEYETLKSQGQLTPQLESLFQQAKSELSNIQEDPMLREAQLRALGSMGEVAREGYTAQEKSEISKLLSTIARDERGNREAINQNMASRGISGSGMELASQLASQQAGADRSYQGSLDLATQAKLRALEALSNEANLAGNIRGQDYEQKARAAEAQDVINKFNLGLQVDQNRNNTGALNTAQEYNLNNNQRIADTNATIRNSQYEYNTGARQTDYQNQLSKASAKANALTGQAAAREADSQRTASQWAGVGQGIAQAGMYNSIYGDKQKKDVV